MQTWTLLSLILSSAFLGLTTMAVPVSADSKDNLFVGTGVGTQGNSGQTSMDEALASRPDRPAFKDDQNVFKGFVGYDFTPYFAAEMFYTYLGRIRFEDSAGASSDFESSAYGMSAVGQMALSPWLTAFAKAGLARWDSRLEGNLDDGTRFELEGHEGTNPVYGIGAQLDFSPFLLRTEYEYYDVDSDYRVDTFTASAGFRF
ncbi:porin family protein [Modicisalibacter xianhensis]|uniref:Opacity protein n=1 Tax=Modicisalibacter xianhensis TaxID=442341 RepID=A0A1I3A851_9GAMM|nr:outer membrane beta-barrel protein [Halomonas xianhensis]SFH45889.1 Opacity protein [Halomonas xianhensis]